MHKIFLKVFFNFFWKFALNSVTILIKIRIVDSLKMRNWSEFLFEMIYYWTQSIFLLCSILLRCKSETFNLYLFVALKKWRGTRIPRGDMTFSKKLPRVSPVISIWLRWDLHKVHCVIGASRMRVQCIISFVYVPPLRKSVLTS
jgi:hypothetical protein